MTLLVIADDDAVRTSVPSEQVDVVISCGDVLDSTILDVARRVGCACVLAVKGNHDSSGDFGPGIVNLHLVKHTVEGLTFGGFQGSWRYKPRGNYLYEQEEVGQQLGAFPVVDVFIAHNSPRHVHDRDDDVHHGFEAFSTYIKKAHPRMLIHGHQHTNRETVVDATRVIGVYGWRRLEI